MNIQTIDSVKKVEHLKRVTDEIFKPAPRPQHDLLAEIDIEIIYNKRRKGHCLKVYGTHQRRFPGTRETPEEPAGYEISRIMLGDSDVTNEIDHDFVQEYLKENC